MAKKLPSYLRTYRKHAGLTQDEVAYLLGWKSGSIVSRYERRSRRPDLEAALGYALIFGVPTPDLLPGIQAELEEAITKRAGLLAEKLASDASGARTKRKLAFLNALTSKGEQDPQQHA